MTIDWTSLEGQQELKELVTGADVFLEDWGPGVADNYGLGYETFSGENSKLVYFSLSAYGEKGPYRDRPTSELVMQGMTGYLRLLGSLGEPPVRVGADIAATCSGSIALTGILSALYYRERTGKGQRVATSLLGAMMFLRSHEWAAMTNPDEWLGDSYCTNETDSPHDGYQTKDRPIYMSPSPLLKHEDFISMTKDLGVHDDLMKHPEYANNWWDTSGMGYLARETKPIWEKYTTKLSAQEAIDIVDKYEMWAVEFADLGNLMDHPQVEAINLVHALEGKRYVRAPWRAPWALPPLSLAPSLKD
jgi:crotonobetainyl-CoA:carnitine CoA-transferase CaiB-like acyl-CoA transferase